MSIIIPIDADFTQVEAKLKGINVTVNKINTQTNDTNIKLMQVYQYSSHIATLISSMATRATQGTEQAIGAQIAAQTIAAVSTQVSIGTTIAQAIAAFTAGNVIQGSALLGTAALMQTNLVQQQQQIIAARQAKKEVQLIREQIQRWR